MCQCRGLQTRIFLLVIFCLKHVRASQPSVTVQSSTLYGLETQVGETTVHEYLGIRFGQPPLGPLRFSKPQPASLPLVLNATQQGSPCPGLLIPAPNLDEDCLFLNVYVPLYGRRGESVPLLPVMVWIYGGSFILGSTRVYDGSILAAQGDVIVVTLNYRLGPFGFLSTGDNSSPGNHGLWDQWLALKWVKDNIEQFGGDVTNITLFGESAGGASVSYQMTSPHSAKLFQKAILQSGCRLCYWAYNVTRSPLSVAKQLGSALQCLIDGDDTEATAGLVSCLREKSVQAIHNASATIRDWTPVTDGDFVLPDGDSQTFTGPVMTGVNNREGGFLVSLLKRTVGQLINNRVFYRDHILKKLLGSTHHSLMTSAPAEAVEDALDVLDCVYRTNSSSDTYVTESEMEAVFGDSTFLVCNQQLLDSEASTGDTYLYYFDHYPDIPGGDKGMDHAMDLSYTFGFHRGFNDSRSAFAGHNVSSADLDLAADFRSLLTNFAKSGNPNQPTVLPNWPTWPPYDKGSKSYLVVASSPGVRSRLKEDKLTVWRETIPALLRSQGAQRLNDTRWGHCYRETNTGRETGSGSAMNVKSSMVVCMFSVLLSMS